ncbi:MAG: protein kinase, partial [Pirellulaceae bacterium]
MSAASPETPSSTARDRRLQSILRTVLTERGQGRLESDEELAQRYPDEWSWIRGQLERLRHIEAALDRAETGHPSSGCEDPEALTDEHVAPATPNHEIGIAEDFRVAPAMVDGSGSLGWDEGVAESPRQPVRLGRYECRELLGQGGFGRVYRAWDCELARHVAIKIPHRHRIADSDNLELFLVEARTLARLDHPAIVPVYDVGRTEDGGLYIVSKWIPGSSLAAWLRQDERPVSESVRIVLGIAEALAYAHRHGVVHRDIKPANILMDGDGRPHVADFGLAVRAEEPGDALLLAGTPQYMSPELVRGESHRIDGRSDLFSLGVVFYEMLAGVRPFEGIQPEVLFDQILHQEVVPLRERDARIPVAIERICLKLLAKRAADRYPTAAELGEELRHVLAPTAASRAGGEGVAGSRRIVPKGLRSFDANDAGFFLDLLPGPRDRLGLPESLRQWKTRIEQTEPDETFPVGVVYGPSGCGKSSFIRAGLLPHLSANIQAVYVEATAEDTEQRLLRRLRAGWPTLPNERGLAECLARFRRGLVMQSPHKLLLVIDQFEQWLHGRDAAGRYELVDALRQCDGARVQCLLLVRDDFWLGVSRFLDELEVPLQQDRNLGLVDLFDVAHARRVLAEFGRAYDRVSETGYDADPVLSAFLEQAVAGLSEDGKVIPVRLALFAEMVKARPWTLATLEDIGGAAGVGVAYLEETFCARVANPQYRLHERAARAVLESLLPETGSPIKGHMRSYPELLDVSGYGLHPRAFKELMRILDAETRLLTPTDPPETDPWKGGPMPGLRYYQLTHDYLVPSLRCWLTKKQESTRSGRAELRLAERARLWHARPEARQLPSLWEWATIRLLTRPDQWTTHQRRLMEVAGRRHVTLLGTLALLLSGFLLGGTEAAAIVRDTTLWFRVNTAPVWMAFGREEAVWPLLEHAADATLRTQLLHRMGYLLLDPEELLTQQESQDDVSVRRAMLLAVGEIGAASGDNNPSRTLRRSELSRQVKERLLDVFHNDTDPGVHAAAEWALRRHELELAADRSVNPLSTIANRGNRQWYVVPNDHTMVVVAGPVQYVMGSPAGELTRDADEKLQRVHLRRSFSIASKETTVEQFQRFVRDQTRAVTGRPVSEGLSPLAPQTHVSWYEAAAYCNWLSAQDGIPPAQWCYLPNGDGAYGAGMQIAANFEDLRGYRLPTEVEWEYACRAGAATPWYFGRSAEYGD